MKSLLLIGSKSGWTPSVIASKMSHYIIMLEKLIVMIINRVTSIKFGILTVLIEVPYTTFFVTFRTHVQQCNLTTSAYTIIILYLATL